MVRKLEKLIRERFGVAMVKETSDDMEVYVISVRDFEQAVKDLPHIIMTAWGFDGVASKVEIKE